MTNRTSTDRLILSTFKASHLWLQINILPRVNALDEALKGKIRGPLSLNSFNTPRPHALLTGPSFLPAFLPPSVCGQGQRTAFKSSCGFISREKCCNFTQLRPELLRKRVRPWHQTMIVYIRKRPGFLFSAFSPSSASSLFAFWRCLPWGGWRRRRRGTLVSPSLSRSTGT